MFFRTKLQHPLLISTAVTCLQPRDASSYVRLPVPQKRSRASHSSHRKWFCKILNKPCFALPVVGRMGKYFEGTALPFKSPPPIYIGIAYKANNTCAPECSQAGLKM